MIILLLIQYFGQRPLSRKTCTSMSTTQSLFHHLDIEVHVFLIMAFGRNIELRVIKNYNDNQKRFETDSEQSLN